MMVVIIMEGKREIAFALLDILITYTDDDHILTAKQLLDLLEQKHDIRIELKTAFLDKERRSDGKTTDKNFPMYKVIGLQLLLLIPSYLIVRFLLFRLHRSDDAPLIAAGVSAIGIFITYSTRKPFVFEGTIYGMP